MMIAGWGNYPRTNSHLESLYSPRDVSKALSGGSIIARGAGRAYGDAALGFERTLSTRGLDRFIAFNAQMAELTVEAGVMLSDVLKFVLPRGLFPAVVPGTQFVTLGGMVASNVHGKNHHKHGSFGNHVARLKIACANGRVLTCGPEENAELFRATLGGMGLTGVILEVTFRLIPIETGYIRREVIVAPNLDAAMQAFEDSQAWTYTVAWIDGLAKGAELGRALVYRGEHARASELTNEVAGDPINPKAQPGVGVPISMPNFTLNRLSVSAFNALYYERGKRAEGSQLVSWRSYFFPLDSIGDWNRIYGRRGFLQHQCVIPKSASRDGLSEILSLIADRGNPSFLTVLKLMGPDAAGSMSFPMEGYTLAVDFPMSQKALELTTEMDRIVSRHGGRIYLAKDAEQSRDTVERGYPNVGAFRALRRATGAEVKFRSLQSERLGL